MNDEFDSLIPTEHGIDVSWLLLGSEYRVIDFGPHAEEIVGLLGSDIGQSIQSLGQHFVDDGLSEAVRERATDWQYVGSRAFNRPDSRIFRKVSPCINREAGVGGFLIVYLALLDSGRSEGECCERGDRKVSRISEEKLESLELIAGGIAHDFNNLLTGILVNLSYAIDEASGNEALMEPLGLVKKSAKQAASLCEQMLSFAGGQSLELTPARLADLVQGGLELVEHLVPANLTIDFKPENRPSHIEADTALMQQAVVNLVMNAIESIGDRSGSIELRTGLKTFGRHFLNRLKGDLSEGAYVFLTVKDTGRGMSASTARRVFEPFFTTNIQGRGLGLATVYGTIRSHGGDISVESIEGKETVFTILLPLAASTHWPLQKS